MVQRAQKTQIRFIFGYSFTEKHKDVEEKPSFVLHIGTHHIR